MSMHPQPMFTMMTPMMMPQHMTSATPTTTWMMVAQPPLNQQFVPPACYYPTSQPLPMHFPAPAHFPASMHLPAPPRMSAASQSNAQRNLPGVTSVMVNPNATGADLNAPMPLMLLPRIPLPPRLSEFSKDGALVCFYCGGKGHKAVNCTSTPSGSGEVSEQCSVHGKIRVISHLKPRSDCPGKFECTATSRCRRDGNAPAKDLNQTKEDVKDAARADLNREA